MERLTGIVAATPDGIIILDAAGVVTFSNAGAERLLRLTRSHIVGRRYDDPSWAVMTVDGQPIPPDQLPYARVMRTGQMVHAAEVAIGRDDGPPSIFSVNAAPTHDANGSLTGVVLAFSDITARKQAEVELQIRLRQQEATARFAKSALTADLPRLFEEATTVLAETLGVDLCKVLELLPAGRALRLVTGVGWRPGLVSLAEVPATSDSQAGFTLLSDAPVIVDDLGTEVLFTGPALLTEHGVVSGMSVVIRNGTQPWGVLGAHTRTRRPFTRDDVTFLEAVAGVLGGAIQRAAGEAALRASRAQLSSILETDPSGIVLVDMSRTVVFANAAAERMTGLRVGCVADEYHAQTRILTTVDGAPFPYDRRPVTQVMQTGRPVEGLEIDIVCPDGTDVVISVNATPVRDADGTLSGVLAAFTDITARARAEATLRESEERFRIMAEVSPVGISLIGPDGGVTYGNPANMRMTGLSPEDTLGLKWIKAIHPEDRERVLLDWQTSMARGDEYAGTGRYLHDDGTIVWWEVRTTALRIGGRLLGHLGTVVDITDRRHAEEQLQKAAAEQRALADRIQTTREEEGTRIARELHDELGQSLTSLKIDLAWMGKRIAKLGDEHLGSVLLKKTTAMAREVDNTIQAVRRLSTELRPSVLDDLGLVAAIEWQAQDFQKRTGIVCTAPIPAEVVTVEPTRATALYRILQGALTNVVRHAEAKRVHIMFSQEEDSLHMEVRDDGRGISQEQIVSSQSIGLVGMRERAQAFGGRVLVTQAESGGTLVRVTMNAA